MGKVMRKKYAAEFKSRIALEVTRGELMLGGAGVETWGHQTMIAPWKRQVIEGMGATFSGKAVAESPVNPADVEKLHAKIGELLEERDFLRDASARLGAIRGARRLARSEGVCRAPGKSVLWLTVDDMASVPLGT